MSVAIESTIDNEIVIVETVDDNVYDYVKKIVEKYGLMPLRVVMRITGKDWFVEVELYNNSSSVETWTFYLL